jgi:hypothetical protein
MPSSFWRPGAARQLNPRGHDVGHDLAGRRGARRGRRPACGRRGAVVEAFVYSPDAEPQEAVAGSGIKEEAPRARQPSRAWTWSWKGVELQS